MANTESKEVKMLEVLIEDAASGKKVDLQENPLGGLSDSSEKGAR